MVSDARFLAQARHVLNGVDVVHIETIAKLVDTGGDLEERDMHVSDATIRRDN